MVAFLAPISDVSYLSNPMMLHARRQTHHTLSATESRERLPHTAEQQQQQQQYTPERLICPTAKPIRHLLRAGLTSSRATVIWEHASRQEQQVDEDNMVKLLEVATIEDFWRAFNNIPKPSAIFSTAARAKSLRIAPSSHSHSSRRILSRSGRTRPTGAEGSAENLSSSW